MEDISNRCREIEQRLREVIEKKKEEKQKEQMNPNVSNDRPGLLNKLNIIERKYVNYSNRPQSRDSQKVLVC